MDTRRAAATAVLLMALGACSGGSSAARRDAADDAAESADAAVTALRFCDGLPPLTSDAVLAPPYVTVEQEGGEACLMTQGANRAGPSCDSLLASAGIELGCPWTSVLFDMADRPFFRRELYVHSAFASLGWGGRAQSGRVAEMVIDETAGDVITGHYRAEFPGTVEFPAVRVHGTFSMCAAITTSFDPCRQL